MATVLLCHDRGIRIRSTEPRRNREVPFPDGIAEKFIAIALMPGNSSNSEQAADPTIFAAKSSMPGNK